MRKMINTSKIATESDALHEKHLEAVVRGRDRIAGKEAILKTWAMEDCPYNPDYRYLKELRGRIRTAIVNFQSMKPVKDSLDV